MGSRRGHGEGSICQRADGRWVGAVDMGMRNGKRVRRHFSGPTRKDVADQVGRALQSLRAGTLAPGKPPSVAQLLSIWLDALTVEPSTRRGYESLVRIHLVPALGRIRLDRLAALDVDRMLAEKRRDGLSPQTCVNLRAALRSALSFARRKGLVAQNVVTLSEYFKAARTGTLPSVAWIDPTGSVSEHPPGLVTAGQTYVTKLVNAAMRGRYGRTPRVLE